MSLIGLVLKGLRTYWRTNLGTAAGMAVATATLVGALFVGDSVSYSLGQGAQARIGRVVNALSSGDRFFRAGLADDLQTSGAKAQGLIAPVLRLTGVASTSDGTRRVQGVNLHGVDERFFALGPGPSAPSESISEPKEESAYLNANLARQLGVQIGDEIVVRVAEPSALPRDVALAPIDTTVALRIRVERVLNADEFGDFGLIGGSTTRPNLFLSATWLQERLGMEGRANLLLSAQAETQDLAARLRGVWTIEDAQLKLRELESGGRELRSDRIFFDEPVIEVLSGLPALELGGVFTYFVNRIELNDRSTPYSMVTGLGALGQVGGGEKSLVLGQSIATDGILLNTWEAQDLGAVEGDQVTLHYHVIDDSRRLVEAQHRFRVEGIVPLEGAAADRSLMPDFPGLSDAEHCRDWEPGTPIDLKLIRDKDETYWDTYGGTPKAFLSLEAARDLWRSRYGELTAVRFDAQAEGELRDALRTELDPGDVGLFFRDVREPALAAANSPTDFGGLFIGLSFFLIGAALLLAGQLFAFGVQQRAREAGLLSALGFQNRLIRRLFLTEAAVLAGLGTALGVALGLVFTRSVLWGLASVWKDAVASTPIHFHAEITTLCIGAAASFLSALGTTWLVIRRELRAPAQSLLAQSMPFERIAGRETRRGLQLAVVVASLIGAALLVLLVDPAAGPSAAGAFFGAGTLTLIGLLTACRIWLRSAASKSDAVVRSLAGLGLANTWRRPGRSLAVIALMAIGTFLVAAVGANRLGPVADEGVRASGTGGFSLYGRTSLPLLSDLNTAPGRDAFTLSEEDMQGVSVVPLRVRAGDDASCLNLSQPSSPRLLGVKSQAFSSRSAFEFASSLETEDNPWSLLDRVEADGAIPAIGDATSLTWQLKLGLGDTIDYVDERGQPFQVRIVASVADSILQGDLLIAEDRFRDLFPSEGGYRLLLVDAPKARVEQVSSSLSRALEDLGLSLESTGQRLGTFHTVQNTYLSVFQLLGGLGVLLGSVGLGIVLLRNTFERRGELALASALGFRAGSVRWWVISEYGSLLVLGLAVGLVSSMVAILPAMRAPASDLSLTQMLQLGAAVAVAGSFWIVIAAQAAVQRAPMAALNAD